MQCNVHNKVLTSPEAQYLTLSVTLIKKSLKKRVSENTLITHNDDL